MGNTNSTMHKFSLYLTLNLLFAFNLGAQQLTGSIRLEQGQTMVIRMDVNNTMAQQAAGRVIDFKITGTAIHQYAVLKASVTGYRLRHEVKHLQFNFSGMGAKREFDSDKPEDMKGPFGSQAKEILSKSYEMTIDTNGTVLDVSPERIEVSKVEDRMSFIFEMLSDLTAIVVPPAKGSRSFFQLLPDHSVTPGESWDVSTNTETDKATTQYTYQGSTATTDSIAVKGSSSNIVKVDRMGVQTKTNMTSAIEGMIARDKSTGIILFKHTKIESTGTTEAAGTTMPIAATTNISIAAGLEKRKK